MLKTLEKLLADQAPQMQSVLISLLFVACLLVFLALIVILVRVIMG